MTRANDQRETKATGSDSARGGSAKRFDTKDAALVLFICAGLAAVFALARWMERHRPPENVFATYEENYVTPEAARRMSLGFNGLVADWYWLRSLQYVGRKVQTYDQRFTLDDLGPLNVKNLGPLLDRATTLDPHFMAAYEFGAVVLPAIDDEGAVRLTEKGIRDNPGEWRLYQYLGYIHWQRGRFREASAAYAAGARLPGAPAWMNQMVAQMEAGGGSRETARAIYRRMYDEAEDEQIRVLAAKRLLQLVSFEHRDAIRAALAEFKARSSRCPNNWRELTAQLRPAGLKFDAAGAPLDPTGVPYVLDECDVKLDERSEIPKK